MNQAFSLFQLQKVDTALQQIRNKINELDQKLKSDERIPDADKAVHSDKLTLEKTRKSLRECEEIVKSTQIEIETNESSLYSGKIVNPKELKDLQEKIISDKKRLNKLEDRQLEAMIELEAAEGQYNQTQKQAVAIQAQVIQDQAHLVGEKEQLLRRIEALEAERLAKLTSVTQPSLEIYLNLFSQKRSVAVALVEERACSACGAPLTPAEWQNARSPTQMIFCASCGRILYAS